MNAQARILFIHGFCSEIHIPVLGIKTTSGSEFDSYREGKEAVHVYNWPISRTLRWWQAINPWSYIRLYRDELRKSQEPSVREALHQEITAVQPEVIFAHSMGCAVFLKYMDCYGVPSTVKRIIFVQGDVPTRLSPVSTAMLTQAGIHIENIYCPWDQALLSSVLYHRQGRGGLTGIISPVVQNRFYPLRKLWNLHTAGLRSDRFYREFCGL